MAGETQSSSLSGTIYAKAIETLIIAYQYDDLTVTPYFRYKTISDFPTTTAAFPRWVKSTGPVAGTPASEVTLLAATEFTTTSVDVAVGRVGIAREITNTAKEDSVVGRALEVQGLIMDAARLYGEFFDTASTALFSTVTATVGGAGASLSIATGVAAIAKQRNNKAKGPQIISLHDNQLKQLQQAQASATSTAWATFYSPSGDGAQFGGYFMNAPVWASALNPTSTGDRLGCIFGDGSRPEYSAFGFVVKRMPSSLEQLHILMDANIWASFCRTGVGIIANNFATSIRSVDA
jgi:hypothetical protein